MINKQKFSIQNTKKVLHKHGKQWIVISAALLMMLGIGSVSTKVSHADSVNNNQVNTVKITNNNRQQPSVISQAKNLHSQILNNADQKSVAQDQTANAPKVENYQPVQVNNGAGKLVSLQKLYTLYENLAASGIFNDNSNTTPVKPNNTPVQPSDHNNNQPVKPSDNSHNQPAKQNSKYLVQNDNNQAAFIFNDTSDFNNDVHPTLMFHDISDPNTPAVNVIGSTQVNGYNLNRIHDDNNSQYNGWVLSDQLNSDQSQKANSQTLASFLNALKQSNNQSQVDATHQYLDTDAAHDAMVFKNRNNFMSDIAVNNVAGKPTAHTDTNVVSMPSSSKNQLVHIIDHAEVAGFKFDRVSDANDSKYNSWVFANSLSNTQNSNYDYKQALQDFLNALAQNGSKQPSDQINANHQYLINSDNATPVFSDVDNINEDFQDPDHPLYTEVSNSSNPIVHIINTASLDGFNFDRISDSSNHSYDGWVLSDELSNKQSSSALYGELQKCLSTIKANTKPKQSSDNADTKYVISTNYMLNSDNLSDLQNNENYTPVNGDKGAKVTITSQQAIDGYIFDYITSSDAKDNNVWIYDGDLSKDKNATASDSDLQSDMISDYVDTPSSSDFTDSVRKELFRDINSDRYKAYGGYQQLNENYYLDELAQNLANKAASGNGSSDFSDQLNSEANNLNITLNNDSWNEAGIVVSGASTINNSPSDYNNMTGQEIADNLNNDEMNYENNDGYFMSSNANTIGIGASYDSTNHQVYYVVVLNQE